MGVSAQVFECQFGVVERLPVVLLLISYTNKPVDVVSVIITRGLWSHLEGLHGDVHELGFVSLALILENHMFFGVVLNFD